MIGDLVVKKFIKNRDDVYSSETRKKYGMLSGTIGIFLNVFLCLLKFISGLLTSSISIMADAINNLSDAGSSVITLVGFKMAGKPADKKHPFGYGRLEYISGLIVSIVIFFMGVELVKSSIDTLTTGEIVTFDWFSLLTLVISIFVKYWMFIFNRNLGKKMTSSVLKATAIDSLSDVMVTITVLIGGIITYVTGVCVDGYTGIIVAIFIMYTGVRTAKDALGPLLGQRPDENLTQNIRKEVLKSKEIMGVHDILVHNYGPTYSLVSLHVEVPSSMSILNVHAIIDATERKIKEKYGCDVVIHMDPVIVDDALIYDISKKMWDFVRQKHECITVEDFRLIKDDGKIKLIFDISVPRDCKTKDEELKDQISRYVNGINEKYGSIINIKRENKPV